MADATVAALQALRDSGRRLVIVTGRELDDLRTVLPRLDLFERIPAENGALLYGPETQRDRRLGDAPSENLVREIETGGVAALSIGASILATLEEHRHTVLAAIADLGLENHLVSNKGALMILPSGVNKASGLEAALAELKLTRHNTVAMGDGENDHALLDLSECGWAVAGTVHPLSP
ncbi:MAG TPA: HAD-IIB family hydrolase [Actinomycetota bacterium]|nr:HAD-IIB family hydrolase [Actinomycetota bacterium]